MDHAAVVASTDVTIALPRPGIIRVLSTSLFSEPDEVLCRQFLRRVLLAPEIESVILQPGSAPAAELCFNGARHDRRRLLLRLADLLSGKNIDENRQLTVAAAATARDRHGVVRYRRYADRVTGWRVERERLGSLQLTNPVLYRKSTLCHAIDRELMGIFGVHHNVSLAQQCRVDIDYDPRRINVAQLIEILDAALAGSEDQPQMDKVNRDLAIATVSLPIAALAQFAVPVLLPAAGALFLYTALPSFTRAWRVLTQERRLGVDVLDSVVVLACLATGQILPGALLAWCLAFGRYLVRRTEDNSKKMLLGAFGKQPRFCWLLREGQEIEMSVDKLLRGDILVVHTGEVVPVDGIIVDGLAMIDQQSLTGEAMPAEKGVGDRVFASTLMVAGKICVSVEQSGSETATAKIGKILQDTAGYKLASQHRGERLADKAVVPTLALGGIALATMGAQGAAAVLNSDMGTGIRIAAPLAMLSTLALCAQRGILVKDGRALDQLCEIDTVLFDKTGTLTEEQPEVGRIIPTNDFSADDILLFAAAAERKFHHPIARAILRRAAEAQLDLPITDDSQYKVGYGITVGVNGRRVRVGSRRFIELEGLDLTGEIQTALERVHREGHTMVMVAVDDKLGGALELRASVRPEVPEIIAGLRAAGIRHIAIISGDHETPTRLLAEQLRVDRYFAQVLPADKAQYVMRLQQEGRNVCFVGDGINDAIALKQANVSVSLRGAASIATDIAHVVFLEQSLGKLCELHNLARQLERNVRISWALILVPNILCIAGVFTLGFGIGASVLTNNIAGLMALANGIRPMRKVAAIEAERRHLLELELRENGYLDIESASNWEPLKYSGIDQILRSVSNN
jgi:heavy metal translocating P-type ATPase